MDIYSDQYLIKRLVFRTGVALHKLYLLPPARHSEVINLVQITAKPIDKFREVLSFWGTNQSVNRNNIITH
jgi:hypothetical protein